MSMFSAGMNRVSSTQSLRNLGYQQVTLSEAAHPSQRLTLFVPSKNKGTPLPLEDPGARQK